MFEIDQWGYDLDKFPSDYFEYFLDIGGCEGEISYRMVQKHSKTEIFCYEPTNEDYLFIHERLVEYNNITVINEALGDGQDLYFNPISKGSHVFLREGLYPKRSRTLATIFAMNEIPLDSRYGLKLDCEGGERFLIGDKDSESIICNSRHLAMEVHFKPNGPKYPYLQAFPAWTTYNDWIRQTFSATHDIKYVRSNRKSGRGVYVLTSKKFQEECDEECDEE